MKQNFEELVDHLMDKGFFLEEAVELMEQTLITRALASTKGNQSAAAKLLGIHRNTLQRKMIDFHLEGKHPRPKPPASANGHKPSARRKTS